MNTNPSLSSQAQNNLHLAFDVGHSSIGWAVLETHIGKHPDILGCGAVTFGADDCLASKRRDFRRQRRHIRATKHRIERMEKLLVNLGIMSLEDLKMKHQQAGGHAAPWLLAARVLASNGDAKHLLDWPQLWDVLRWYAHNRGYDGNRRWSSVEADAKDEDTEKEENAKTLMQKHGVSTMAETFCKELRVDPFGTKQSSEIRFKGLNAAFPRFTVEQEIKTIIRAHFGRLPHVDENLEHVLFDDAHAIACPAFRLPLRFDGGLLFGQSVPRFDNRIIAECPISGKKVPSRDCPEFLRFRWAMQLANIRVAPPGATPLRPLNINERQILNQRMIEAGAFTAGELRKLVREVTGCARDNLDTMLMHPDAKEALLLDPVRKLLNKDHLVTLWPKLPEQLRKRGEGKLRRFKPIRLAELLKDCPAETRAKFDAELQRILDAENTKKKKKEKPLTADRILNGSLQIKKLGMRAAYARPILQQAHDEVMAGKHPKEEGGCLFVTEAMRETQLQRKIDEQTNNHLVRHRLLILERLQRDIIKEFASSTPSRIERITIEVNRDLRQMSGKSAKEKAQDLGQRIANHHNVSVKLEKDLKDAQLNSQPIRITPGLIRKARIADDLGWTCPYTGQKYEPMDLVTRRVDKDHIVPRSQRPSDSLDSLVITFSTINNWKGNRTALQFIIDEQGKQVPDMPNLSIQPLAAYRRFAESLEAYKGHDDDKRRKKRRKELLAVERYEEKEFVPRDLTQTSQIVRFGAQILRKPFLKAKKQPVVVSLPGSVTGTVRKGWNLLGCLGLANPEVMEEDGSTKTKTDIRNITHLHHALDACVLGLAAEFIPNNGSVWELIVKRNPNETERHQLRALGIFDFDGEGRFGLRDLPDKIKNQLRQCLAERRVVQHMPSDMNGMRAEQNTWRVVKVENGIATIRQQMRGADGKLQPPKQTTEKVAKLIGLEKGKLQNVKGALVVGENFGLALDPEPTVIPWHKVWHRVNELKQNNGGKWPRLLRNGTLIRVHKGKFTGIWKVFSLKNNATGIALDMGCADVVRLQNKTDGHKINVLLNSLLQNGMEILKTPLTGLATPTLTE